MSTHQSYKAYCVIEITDNLKSLPDLHATKSEAIEYRRSNHGHPCDDPRKRGVVCKAIITVEIPDFPQVTEELLDYVRNFEGSPALLCSGDEEWNKKAINSANKDQSRRLKILDALLKADPDH